MVEPVIVEHHKLEKILAQQFTEESSFEFSDEEFDLDVDLEAPSSQEDEEETPQGDEAPIVKYINKLLIDAIRMGLQTYILNPMRNHIGSVIESTACYVRLQIHLCNWLTVWLHV